jgi:hypothetical protein
MFNLFFRRYVPGFRVRSDGVPGFNVGDSSLPQRASDSSDGTPPESAAQPYPDAAQTQSPDSISFSLPGAEGWVLSAPLIGSPGFRVSPQDDVPGFNVKPQDDVPGFNIKPPDDAPGFNLDENGVPQPETTWFDGLRPGSVALQDLKGEQPPTPPQPPPPAPPPLPEWPYKLGTMPPPRLSTAFDPRTEPPIAINPLPGLGSAAAPGADPWPSSSVPQQPADSDIRSGAAATQDTNPQPAAQQAMPNAWPRPLTIGRPYAQANGGKLQDPWSVGIARQAAGVPPTLSARPLADSNFIPANAGDQGVQPLQQKTPLPHEQQTQQKVLAAPLGTGLANMSPPPPIGALPIEPSVYRPGNDAGHTLFDLVQGAPENRAQGLAAEAAELKAILKADPQGKTAQQIRIYAEGGPSYMVADIMFSSAGVARVAIVEVKSGAGDLTPQQIEKLGEAARTGKIYIVNEDAARHLEIDPRITFAAQKIIPLVWVVGGNQKAIARQLRNQGLEVVPEGVGRRGRPARLLIVPPI